MKEKVRIHRRASRYELTEEERELAAELVERATRLRENSEDGLSITEAVAMAAFQMGRS